MATSRLEKIGTIFTRFSTGKDVFLLIKTWHSDRIWFGIHKVTGLLRSGALKWENKPLWYNVYRAFPPINEITFDTPKPEDPIRKIFYAEDRIRAKFQENLRPHEQEPTRLFDQTPSQCQTFIHEVKVRTEDSKSEQTAFNEVFRSYKKAAPEKNINRSSLPEDDSDERPDISLSSEFQAALETQNKSVGRSTRVDTTKTINTTKLMEDIFKEEK